MDTIEAAAVLLRLARDVDNRRDDGQFIAERDAVYALRCLRVSELELAEATQIVWSSPA